MRTQGFGFRSSTFRVLMLVALLISVDLLVVAGSSDAAFPGGNGKIAFQSGLEGNLEIYVINADGTGQTRLTDLSAPNREPAWSADGSKLAFTSGRDGNQEIYVMNADGSGQTRLTDNPDFDHLPAWSPDGLKIAFASRRDGDVNEEIYVMNADGSNPTRLTDDVAFNSEPVWSPDGSKLAFTSNRDGNAEIYVMNADGSNQTRLTENPASESSPAWSPNGARLALRSDRDGNFEIYLMNADGGGQTRLTENTTFDGQPAWSPDGSKLAFLGEGAAGIVVMNADGGGQTELAIGSGPDWQPIPDHEAPTISCDASDGIWHAAEVSIACTARDDVSGLTDPVDASFSLATSVASGMETANASTSTRNVCDRVGNCATAGPIGGNKIDKKVPTISLASPTGATYLLHQPVAADYVCFDPGSGVASCAAPVPSGVDINTAAVGSKTFTVRSVDNVGNAAPTQSAMYRVAYGVRLLFDPGQSTKTITLQLADANGANVSAAAIVLTVQTIDGVPVSGETFSFSKNPATYKYAPKVGAGTHTLTLTATGDPTTHAVTFLR